MPNETVTRSCGRFFRMRYSKMHFWTSADFLSTAAPMSCVASSGEPAKGRGGGAASALGLRPPPPSDTLEEGACGAFAASPPPHASTPARSPTAGAITASAQKPDEEREPKAEEATTRQ